jgi:flagellar secretion chaperone FliS
MAYGSPNTQYLEADVMSRPREWLVPLLYEHLLSSLRRAGVQIEVGDLGGKSASIEKASSIVMELIATLDRERGGELASQLAALYGFFAGEILTVSRTLELERLERLIALIEELHGSWVQAAEAVAPRGRPTLAAGGRIQ